MAKRVYAGPDASEVTSVRIEYLDAQHASVTVYNRHGNAGSLTVESCDAETIARRLTRELVDGDGELRVVVSQLIADRTPCVFDADAVAFLSGMLVGRWHAVSDTIISSMRASRLVATALEELEAKQQTDEAKSESARVKRDR